MDVLRVTGAYISITQPPDYPCNGLGVSPKPKAQWLGAAGEKTDKYVQSRSFEKLFDSLIVLFYGTVCWLAIYALHNSREISHEK